MVTLGMNTQQQRWNGFLKRAAIPEPHPTFESVVGSVEAFLMPVASTLADGRGVPAFWRPGGPWSNKGEGGR